MGPDGVNGHLDGHLNRVEERLSIQISAAIKLQIHYLPANLESDKFHRGICEHSAIIKISSLRSHRNAVLELNQHDANILVSGWSQFSACNYRYRYYPCNPDN